MDDENPNPHLEAESLHELADTLTRFIEISAGHRERCIQAGFSPTIAEQMAFTIHQGLCIRMFGAQG